MKGLILKDLYTLKKQFSFLGIYIILIAALSFMTDAPYTFMAAISVVVAMSPITVMSYDSQCQWEKYANILPLKRSAIVMSKYCLGVLLSIPMFLYNMIMNIISNRNFSVDILSDSVYSALIIVGISIIVLAVMMPFVFKFGVEKGRIMIVIVFCMIAAAGVGAFFSVDFGGKKMFAETLINILSNKALLSAIVVASAAVLLSISIMISTKIYKKKEF